MPLGVVNLQLVVLLHLVVAIAQWYRLQMTKAVGWKNAQCITVNLHVGSRYKLVNHHSTVTVIGLL